MNIQHDYDKYCLFVQLDQEAGAPTRLQLEVGIKTFEFDVPHINTAGPFSLPLDRLLEVNDFTGARLVGLLESGDEWSVLASDAGIELDELLIKGLDDFWKRVNSPARIIKNQFVLRHCCKRAVAQFPTDFNVLGSTLCALGYRILDLEDPNDPDIPWFDENTVKLFQWMDPIDAGDEARWVTSVGILNAYKELDAGRREGARVFLEKCLHYRNMVKYRPMIQINIARSFFLLADLKVKAGQFAAAIELFKQVDRVAIEGVVFSDLSSPVAGRHKFSEFIACMRAVKESRIAIRELQKLIKTNETASSLYNTGALSGYVNTLYKRGRI